MHLTAHIIGRQAVGAVGSAGNGGTVAQPLVAERSHAVVVGEPVGVGLQGLVLLGAANNPHAALGRIVHVVDGDGKGVAGAQCAVAGCHRDQHAAHIGIQRGTAEGACGAVELQPSRQGVATLEHGAVGERGARVDIREGIGVELEGKRRVFVGCLVRQGLCHHGCVVDGRHLHPHIGRTDRQRTGNAVVRRDIDTAATGQVRKCVVCGTKEQRKGRAKPMGRRHKTQLIAGLQVQGLRHVVVVQVCGQWRPCTVRNAVLPLALACDRLIPANGHAFHVATGIFIWEIVLQKVSDQKAVDRVLRCGEVDVDTAGSGVVGVGDADGQRVIGVVAGGVGGSNRQGVAVLDFKVGNGTKTQMPRCCIDSKGCSVGACQAVGHAGVCIGVGVIHHHAGGGVFCHGDLAGGRKHRGGGVHFKSCPAEDRAGDAIHALSHLDIAVGVQPVGQHKTIARTVGPALPCIDAELPACTGLQAIHTHITLPGESVGGTGACVGQQDQGHRFGHRGDVYGGGASHPTGIGRAMGCAVVGNAVGQRDAGVVVRLG